MSHIVFSHGNSFPASTYRVLLDSLRARGYAVSAIEKFGHDPQYPVTDGWPHLVQQLADFAAAHTQASSGQAPWLVGHSLGGILSLMCAAQHPELARGVLLLDSPIIRGWRARGLRLVKSAALMPRISPSQVSRRRRHEWNDREAVFQYFRSKKTFAAWDEQVLHDYVNHGTFDADGVWRLAFDRDVESQIYDTLPHTLGSLLRRHPLRCPVAFIGGLHSAELKQMGGIDNMQRLARGRTAMLDGTHLFPMEKPLVTAAAAEAFLRDMG